jgi:predicted transcriptional regulator
MKLHLAPDAEAKLNDLARRTHRSTDELLGQAVDYLVAYNEWFERKVRNSMAAAEGTQAVRDEEVGAWLERRERIPRGRGGASPRHDGPSTRNQFCRDEID